MRSENTKPLAASEAQVARFAINAAAPSSCPTADKFEDGPCSVASFDRNIMILLATIVPDALVGLMIQMLRIRPLPSQLTDCFFTNPD